MKNKEMKKWLEDFVSLEQLSDSERRQRMHSTLKKNKRENAALIERLKNKKPPEVIQLPVDPDAQKGIWKATSMTIKR